MSLLQFDCLIFLIPCVLIAIHSRVIQPILNDLVTVKVTDLGLDVEEVSVVDSDVGHDLQHDERVLNVCWLLADSDIRRALTEPWTLLHT